MALPPLQLDIPTQHMKHRRMCIAAMCAMSTYTWITTPIYIPLTRDLYNVSGLNIMFFQCYLWWDMWCMLFGPNRTVLYRTELIIHHTVSSILFATDMYFAPVMGSHALICESISLLNYTLRGNDRLLHRYRIAAIFLIRFPIFIGHSIYYTIYADTVLAPVMRSSGISIVWLTAAVCVSHIFFVLYDIILLRKIFGILRKKRM